MVVRRHKVLLKCAGAYDDVSRVAIVEMEKPKGFRYEPGQHVMLNLPWIGKICLHAYIHASAHVITYTSGIYDTAITASKNPVQIYTAVLCATTNTYKRMTELTNLKWVAGVPIPS